MSGAQKRKTRKRNLEECKSMSQQFAKWLRKEKQEGEGPAQSVESSTSSQDTVQQLPVEQNGDTSQVNPAQSAALKVDKIILNLRSTVQNEDDIPKRNAYKL